MNYNSAQLSVIKICHVCKYHLILQNLVILKCRQAGGKPTTAYISIEQFLMASIYHAPTLFLQILHGQHEAKNYSYPI